MNALSLMVLIATLFLTIMLQVKLLKRLFWPSTIFCIFWLFMTMVPLVVVWDVEVSLIGCVYIAAVIMSFVASGLVAKKIYNMNAGSKGIEFRQCRLQNMEPPLVLILACSGAAVVMILLNLVINGYGIKVFMSDPFKSAGALSTARYEGEFKSTAFGFAIFPLIYIPSALAGFKLAITRRARKYRLIFIVLLPSILVMLTMSAKGSFILSLVLIFAGYIYDKVCVGGDWGIKFSWTLLIKGATYVAISVLLIGLSFYSRGLSDAGSDYAVWKLKSYFLSYATGHFYAFMDWFSSYMGYVSSIDYEPARTTYGAYNHLFVFEIFADKSFERGVFTEYYRGGNYIKSNIYTMFRGLITDFGVAGSLLVMFIYGFVLNLAAEAASRRPGPLSFATFCLGIAFVYQSFIFNILNYMSIFGFFVATIFVMMFCKVLNASK